MSSLTKAEWWAVFAVWTVYLLLIASVSVYNLSAYWKLHSERPVSIRAPQLVVANHLVAFVFMILMRWIFILCELFEAPAPFLLRYINAALGIAIFAGIFVMRAWYLNWSYAYTRHLLKEQWRKQLDLSDSYVSRRSWAVQYAWLFHDWRCLALYGVGGTIVLITSLTLIWLFVTHKSLWASIVVFLLLFAPVVTALLVAMLRNHSSRDIYHFRQEISIVVVMWLLFAFTSPLIYYFLPPTSLAFAFIWNFRGATILLVHNVATTRWVLWRTQHLIEEGPSFGLLGGTRPAAFSVSKSALSVRNLNLDAKASASDVSRALFNRILSDSDGFKMFAEHCVREVSIENVLFVVSYMRFKQYLHSFVHSLAVDSERMTVTADPRIQHATIEDHIAAAPAPRSSGGNPLSGVGLPLFFKKRSNSQTSPSAPSPALKKRISADRMAAAAQLGSVVEAQKQRIAAVSPSPPTLLSVEEATDVIASGSDDEEEEEDGNGDAADDGSAIDRVKSGESVTPIPAVVVLTDTRSSDKRTPDGFTMLKAGSSSSSAVAIDKVITSSESSYTPLALATTTTVMSSTGVGSGIHRKLSAQLTRSKPGYSMTKSTTDFLFAPEYSATSCTSVRGLPLQTFGNLVTLPRELVAFQLSEADCPSLDACVHKLLDIYDLFLRHDGANTLNVSGRIRNAALDKLRTFVMDDDYLESEVVEADAKPQTRQIRLQRRKAAREIDTENKTLQNVFDTIKTLDLVLKQALSVLRHDSFPRFLETPEFQRWVEANQE